jgi:hypothetical protein
MISGRVRGRLDRGNDAEKETEIVAVIDLFICQRTIQKGKIVMQIIVH